MVLSKSGKSILKTMGKTYKSAKKAKEVFYSMINAKKKGTKKWEKE